MKPIWHLGASLGVAVLALLLSVAPAFGIQLSGVWQEEGDAPDGVAGTPQDTTGSGPLTGIGGDLGEPLDLADVVDMFRIRASSGASEIKISDSGFNSANFLVFLFDSSGAGLGAGYFPFDAFSPKTLAVAVSAGLEYLLAVSLPEYVPIDSATTPKPLFNDDGTPNSAAGLLAGWSDTTGSVIQDPPFSFTLTGVEPFTQTQVPEPATLALLGSGLAGLAAAAWRRRRN